MLLDWLQSMVTPEEAKVYKVTKNFKDYLPDKKDMCMQTESYILSAYSFTMVCKEELNRLNRKGEQGCRIQLELKNYSEMEENRSR